MSQPPSSDEQLIAAFRRSGQGEAIEALIRRQVGQVWAMIYQMVLNETDADDLTQEVFVRAIRGIDGFRGQSRFSTWLYRIAMNTVRGFLRRQRRVQPVPDEALAQRPDCRVAAPDAVAAAAELDRDLTAAVGSLSPALRAAVVLTRVQGLSVGEAAQVEGCTAATMYWRVHKARKALKTKLAKYLK